MGILFVSGQPRSGKTAIISLVAALIMDGGGLVHANLQLFESHKGKYENGNWTGKLHPNYRPLTIYKLVEIMEGRRVEPNQTLLAHEIQTWLHSHKAMTDVGLFGSIFIGQSAKLGYDWLIDSQITMKVEDDFRKLADCRLKAENDAENKQFTYHILDTNYPNEDIDTGESFNIPYAIMQFYWNRYDTYVPNPPVELAELKAKMEKLVPDILKHQVENLVKLLMEKRELYGLEYARDVNKQAVEYALMCEALPSAHAGLVAVGMKLSLRRSSTQ